MYPLPQKRFSTGKTGRFPTGLFPAGPGIASQSGDRHRGRRQIAAEGADVIEVAIIDDHPLARRGLSAILSEAADIVITSSTASPGAAPTVIDGLGRPSVVLLDLYLGTDDPCLSLISLLSPATKILVVSASGRPADVLGAIRAGASGYITKTADPPLIVAATRVVAGGGFALSPQLADILQAELAPTGEAPRIGPGPSADPETARLSPREEQALDLIARGFTHGQAASRMGVAKGTVDTYVERIRAKLQVGNKAELTRAALQRVTGAGEH
jgi:two-component system nitrate/nitrite response regulator NarL